jgi:hypothetical protein
MNEQMNVEHWWNDTDRQGTFPSAADLMWTHLGTNLGSVETGWQLTALSMAQPVMDIVWVS